MIRTDLRRNPAELGALRRLLDDGLLRNATTPSGLRGPWICGEADDLPFPTRRIPGMDSLRSATTITVPRDREVDRELRPGP